MTTKNLVSHTVLVVDDEAELLDALKFYIERLGASVLTASNGEEALKVLSKVEVDCVVSDIRMPRLTGLSLLRRLREAGNHVPFIVITGYGDRESVLEALRLGVYDFIDKPFDHKRLLDVLESAIKMGVAVRELELRIDDLCKKGNVPPEHARDYRRAVKTLGLMRLHRTKAKKAA